MKRDTKRQPQTASVLYLSPAARNLLGSLHTADLHGGGSFKNNVPRSEQRSVHLLRHRRG